MPFGSTISYTLVTSSVVVHTIPSSTTNVLALDTAQNNIENEFSSFPNLYEVSTTMFDDFEKFMSEMENNPNVSSIEIP